MESKRQEKTNGGDRKEREKKKKDMKRNRIIGGECCGYKGDIKHCKSLYCQCLEPFYFKFSPKSVGVFASCQF